MSTPMIWVTMGMMGLVTYLLRLSFIVAWERLALPTMAREALRYVPPAVLAAIVMPELLKPGGGPLDLSLGNIRLIAGLVATIVAWRTHNALLTIATGMLILVATQWLL